jgi:hypothetical protein
MNESLKGKQGGCMCGAVRYCLTEQPMFVQACHCSDCQRISGSAFAVNMWTEEFNVDLQQGELVSWIYTGGSGNKHEMFSCARCGTNLWSKYYAGLSNTLFVRAGTLDDPEEIRPMAHIHIRSRQRWFDLPDDVPHFDEFYKLADTWPADSLARLRQLKS